MNATIPEVIVFDARLLEEKSYWLDRLSQRPEPASIPPDREQSSAVAAEVFTTELPEEARAALTKMTGGSPFLLYVALLAGLKVCLRRYGAGARLVVGSPALKEAVRPNALAVMHDLEERASFKELLLGVRQTLLDTYARQSYPHHYLLRDLGLEGGEDGRPLFDVSLGLEGLHGEMPAAGESLKLQASATASALTLEARYDGARFERSTIERFLRHYSNVLRQAAGNPGARVLEIDALDEAESREVIHGWNATQTSFAPCRAAQQLFEERAAEEPSAPAVIDGAAELSYGELNERANRLAHYLIAQSVGPETVVGLCLERSTEMLVALLGVLKAGGAYLPLDISQPPERLSFMIKDAGARLTLTSGELAARLAHTETHTLALDQLNEALAAESCQNPSARVGPDNLAYVIYTSGSTGRPKGVMVPHGGLVNYLRWAGATYLAGVGGSLVHTPLGFDLTVTSLLVPLSAGRRVELLPEARGVQPLADALRRGGGHGLLKITPAHLDLLAQLLPAGEAAGKAGALVIGGEALRREQLDFWRRHAPATRLFNEYGPTEAVVGCCVHEVNGAEPSAGAVPIGRPIGNTALYVLDGRLRPAPVGVTGEIYLGGVNLARGYLNRPDVTAERFVPNPFDQQFSTRLYRTGDLARYRADGVIEYLGRNDDQVKLRGYRIELGEIESALCTHPAVREAAAVVREDVPGDKRLVAYYVALAEVGVGELRSHLSSLLPDYMVPTAVIRLDALPLTANGKLDRKALPAPSESLSAEEYAAPRTPSEEIVSGIFADLLGLARIGATDNFFELGGHSLLAMQAVSRLRQSLGVEIPLRSLFEAPTARQLAPVVEAARADEDAAPAPPPLRRAGREVKEPVPASFAQQRLWFIHQLDPHSAAYNVPVALRLAGRLDIAALRRTLAEVVRRHESLRTRFVERNGEPFQLIEPARTLPLPVIDLSGLEEERAKREALRLAQEEARAPFDLGRGPLARARLLRVRAEEHVALWTMHHVVSDGWSTGVLIGEVAALYEAYTQGEASPLAELAVQYADYAEWQRGWLQGEALDAQLRYWREQLADAPAELTLPRDRARKAGGSSGRGGIEPVELSEELSDGLRALARREGATLFMVLLAGFQALLHRYSGQTDICVGTPVAGRRAAETEGLIGCFVNTLVMRSSVRGDTRFRELLKSVREVTLGAYTHQDVPFERLVEELQIERSLEREPLFQVMFALQNVRQQSLELSGLELNTLDHGAAASPFDLTLVLLEREGRLSGAFEYDADLFDASTVRRMAQHLRTLLAGAAEEPERTVAGLPLLEESERHRLLREWNATRAPYPSDKPLNALFEERVASCPERSALICGDVQLSYGELNDRANRLARRLRRLGVGLETRVGVALPRSPEAVVSILAVLKAGAVYVPLDPDYPQGRLEWMISDAGCGVILTLEASCPKLQQVAAQLFCLDTNWPEVEREEAGPLPTYASGRAGAYVVYTSGSTGRPKGVIVEHSALVNHNTAVVKAYGLNGADRVLQFTSLSFDVAAEEIFPTLLCGATLVMYPNRDAESVGEFMRTVEKEGVSVVNIPTPYWHELVMQVTRREVGLPPGLRLVVTGSDTVAPDKLRLWQSAVGSRVRWVNAYGPTEAAITTTLYEPRPDDTPEQHASVPIGKPIANTSVYILDATLNPQAVGIVGELYLGGAGLARGYWQRPALTAERFVPDPFSAEPGARLYRTGDLARWRADGTVEFLGRADQQVKLRGYRIELGEVEAALCAQPGVRTAAALVREDAPGERRLVGYVVGDAALDVATVREGVRTLLPDYMTPTVLMRLDALPLTASGKLDRKALPAPAEAAHTGAYAAPRTPAEEIVCGVFADLLGLARVGAADNFFELGGHSLLAMQAVSRLRQSFGVEVALRSLFEGPTPRQLAEAVEAARESESGAEVPPLHRMARGEGELVAASFAQQRLWFIHQLDPQSAAYNVPVALRLEGRLDVAALGRTLTEVVRRHESLRTRFVERDGEPYQLIEPSRTLPLPVVDLSGLGEERARREAVRLAREEAGRPFDLGRGPLVRARLLRIGAEEQVALWTMHHVVSDGWSTGVLVREVAALYEAYTRGEASPLAELAVQYADYAAWQRGWLQGEALEAQLRYWREQLEGAPSELRLPHERKASGHGGGSGAELVELSEEVSEGLRGLGRREGATLFMVLLAGFQALLYRYTGQADFCVGTNVAGRNLFEVENLIGYFVNTLPLRADLSGARTFEELLRGVRARALGAYAHQDLPFEKLVEELKPERKLGREPLVQVILNFDTNTTTELSLPSLRLSPLAAGESIAKYDLLLNLQERGRAVVGQMIYQSPAFDPAAAGHLAREFESLLGLVARDPSLGLPELCQLLEEDAQRRRAAEREQFAAARRRMLLNLKVSAEATASS